MDSPTNPHSERPLLPIPSLDNRQLTPHVRARSVHAFMRMPMVSVGVGMAVPVVGVGVGHNVCGIFCFVMGYD